MPIRVPCLVRAKRAHLPDHQRVGPSAGHERALQWRTAAAAALHLYGDHPAVPFEALAAKVATEVRLLRAIQAELAAHAAAREQRYLRVDPAQLASSLPGFAEISPPVLVAVMGRPGRFRDGTRFKSYAGLAPCASETGETDRKGQPMSKAGPSLLRATLFRAADTARRQDPQLARIYYLQMTERGATHLKACCVVAGHLAERAWGRAKPRHSLRDLRHRRQPGHRRAGQADHRGEVDRPGRRPQATAQPQKAGKAPQAATRPDKRGDPPRPRSSRPRGKAVNPVT
jgi:Transposase IS116/IS110/IS902 family